MVRRTRLRKGPYFIVSNMTQLGCMLLVALTVCRAVAAYTRDNLGTRLGIVIDGRLYCAPVIRAEIPGGKAEISGNFTDQEARDLVEKITAAIEKD